MSDDTVTARLAEWATLTEAATEGPWIARDEENGFPCDWVLHLPSSPEHEVLWMSDLGTIAQNQGNNAEFIAAARTAMPALLGFVKDVLAIHHQGPDYCAECVRFAPCPTVRALTKWIGGA